MTTNIRIHEKLMEILDKAKNNDKLSETIETLENLSLDPDSKNYINYLSIAQEDNSKLSYLNKSKIDKDSFLDRVWDPSYRIMAKPGKVLKMLMPSVSDKTMELFSAVYKTQAEVCSECLDSSIVKFVTGNDIAYYYYEDRYSRENMDEGSNLWNSCMRDSDCRDFFGIYTKNPESVSLALLLDSLGLVIARCLIWSKNEKKYYDRIYALNDSMNRKMQACLEKLNFLNLSPKNVIAGKGELTIQLQCGYANIDYFPYMDTMRYLSGNTLSTFCDDMEYELDSTSGDCTSLNATTCDNCGDDCHEDDLSEIVVGSGQGDYYCHSCCEYSKFNEGYIFCGNAVFVQDRKDWLLKIDCVELHNGNWGYCDDCVYLYNDEYDLLENTTVSEDGESFLDGDDNFEEIDGRYYNIKSEKYANLQKTEPA